MGQLKDANDQTRVAPIDIFHSSMKQTLKQGRERAFQVPLSRRSWVRRRRRRLQRRVANSSSNLLHRQALYVQPILPNEERLHLIISWSTTTPKGPVERSGANLYAWTSCESLIDMNKSVHRPCESSSRCFIGAPKT
eukprot:scaffold2046_cov178-Skeletonema_dohrnii-CCMP3373.AAC.1